MTMEKYLARGLVGLLVAGLLVVGASAAAQERTKPRAQPEVSAANAARDRDVEPNTRSDALFRRAVVAFEEKRLDDAAKLLRRLLKRHPRNVAVLNNLAVVLLEMDRSDEAIELLRRALSSNQGIMTAYGNLTAVYERKAADAYRNALNIEPKDAEPLPLSLITVLDAPPVDEPRGARDKALAAPPRGKAVTDEVLRADNIDRPFVDDPIQATAKADKPKTSSAAKTPASQATQKPAQKPTQKPVKKEPKISAQQELAIEEAVNRWANAWSDRDLSAYYDSYVSGHAPGDLTHEEWRAFRAERLTAPQSIEVTLFDFVIASATRDKAQVEFVQRYRSSVLSSDSVKRLYLVREDGDWKIARETLLRRLK